MERSAPQIGWCGCRGNETRSHLGCDPVNLKSVRTVVNLTIAEAVSQNVEPEVLKECLDDMMDENRICILYHATVVGTTRVDNQIISIESQERRGRRHIHGRAFVDCLGDGVLAFQAGASTWYGNHGHVNMGPLASRLGGLQSAKPNSKDWTNAIIAAKKMNPELHNLIPRATGILISFRNLGTSSPTWLWPLMMLEAVRALRRQRRGVGGRRRSISKSCVLFLAMRRRI